MAAGRSRTVTSSLCELRLCQPCCAGGFSTSRVLVRTCLELGGCYLNGSVGSLQKGFRGGAFATLVLFHLNWSMKRRSPPFPCGRRRIVGVRVACKIHKPLDQQRSKMGFPLRWPRSTKHGIGLTLGPSYPNLNSNSGGARAPRHGTRAAE